MPSWPPLSLEALVCKNGQWLFNQDFEGATKAEQAKYLDQQDNTGSVGVWARIQSSRPSDPSIQRNSVCQPEWSVACDSIWVCFKMGYSNSYHHIPNYINEI
jgi:hypothetical protein